MLDTLRAVCHSSLASPRNYPKAEQENKKMTRKDFELIAEVIKTSQYYSADYRNEIARNMAQALAATNPAFNEDRFLKACGAW
jgi:hypothetical protein